MPQIGGPSPEGESRLKYGVVRLYGAQLNFIAKKIGKVILTILVKAEFQELVRTTSWSLMIGLRTVLVPVVCHWDCGCVKSVNNRLKVVEFVLFAILDPHGT